VSQRIASDDDEVGFVLSETTDPVDLSALPRCEVNVGKVQHPDARRSRFENINGLMANPEHISLNQRGIGEQPCSNRDKPA
jgi:hypothetical protein